MQGRSRTVIDDSGSLAITAWTCADCGELIEELRILSRDGTVPRPSSRYVVAPQAPTSRGRLQAHRLP